MFHNLKTKIVPRQRRQKLVNGFSASVLSPHVI